MSAATKPIGIFYEHPHWFLPLFAKLEERNTPFVAIDATSHQFDPAHPAERDFALVLNRMSPSAYRRGHAFAIFYTHQYLGHLEAHGVRVINGSRAFRYETSKALQLSLLTQLGLPAPRARVINHASQAISAAAGLRFPIVVKPNIGGSGAGIVRFETSRALAVTVDAGQLDLGLDSTALVQEFIPARDGYIVRIEILGGDYLYAIRVSLGDKSPGANTFNLCPADICNTALPSIAPCTHDATRTAVQVTAYDPPKDVINAVRKITAASGIEVGGVEYLADDRDGQLYFYDINALSNFVADAPNVIGFDPFDRLAEFLEAEAWHVQAGAKHSPAAATAR